MKKLTVLFILNLVAVMSYAQLEIYSRYTINGTVEPDINIFGVKKISNNINLTYFALIEQKWSEALIGFSYSPKKWISVGLSTGIEYGTTSARFGGSVWLGKGKISLLIIGEKGEGTDNYFYKSRLLCKISETFQIGAMAWRFHGIGPVFRYDIKKINSNLWLLPAYDAEFNTKRLIFGLSVGI